MQHPSEIQIKDYTYELPSNRIAKYPLSERDLSKLLIYKDGAISEDVYRNIGTYLSTGTTLLFNNTRVIEARLFFQKSTGSIIEVFCLEPAHYQEISLSMSSHSAVRWNCLVGGASKWKEKKLEKKIEAGTKTISLFAEIIERLPDCFVVEFSWTNDQLAFGEVLHLAGVIPLPPYLNRDAEAADYERYQTVYAKQEGSVAAPTAGLHFTDQLLDQLRQKGIHQLYVTLHVGMGTFRQVKSETMKDHDMHKEWILVNKETISRLLDQVDGAPVIPVGTTSFRTLESLFWMGAKAHLTPEATIEELQVKQWDAYEPALQNISAKESLRALLNRMETLQLDQIHCHTQLLVAPGYKVRLAKVLVTNFHQPDSTLLLLVAAITGDDWRKIYQYALENDFRFLSYGDGCLLWVRQ